jgi:hypothetical protein
VTTVRSSRSGPFTSKAMPYKNLKKSKTEEAREINAKESEAGGSEFELSKAEVSEEIWIY